MPVSRTTRSTKNSCTAASRSSNSRPLTALFQMGRPFPAADSAVSVAIHPRNSGITTAIWPASPVSTPRMAAIAVPDWGGATAIYASSRAIP